MVSELIFPCLSKVSKWLLEALSHLILAFKHPLLNDCHSIPTLPQRFQSQNEPFPGAFHENMTRCWQY